MEGGKIFINEIHSFLDSFIENTDLRTSDVLSADRIQPLGLSYLDLCQFVNGMIKEGIITSSFGVEISPSDRLIVFDKEIYSILKDVERIFHDNYRSFMSLENFCKIGELEKVNDEWFFPDYGIFKGLYLTKNGKIGCRTWSIEAIMESIAWELIYVSDYWHSSEMGKALKYLFPSKFNKTTDRQINSYISRAKDKFQHKIFLKSGSKGYWQLTKLGDGCYDDKEAIIRIFHEVASPLYYKEVTKKLKERKWKVNDETIYQLLYRNKDIFEILDSGYFRLKENDGLESNLRK